MALDDGRTPEPVTDEDCEECEISTLLSARLLFIFVVIIFLRRSFVNCEIV